MARHRATVFGDQAPWAPTLVRVQDDRVDAWTGWRMGAALVQALGVAGSARVLAIVGQEQDSFRPNSALRRTIGRRSFLSTAVGAAIGALTLSGLATPAQATPLRGNARATGKLISGNAVTDPVLKLLEGADAQQAFGAFYPPQKLLADLADGRTRRTDAAAHGPTSTEPLEVMAHIDEHRGRKTTSVVVHHSASGRFFRAYQEESNGQVLESTAEVYEIAGNGATLRMNSISINGSRPEPTAFGPGLEGPASADQDPCGGCAGSGGPGDRSRRVITRCVDEIDVACALGFAGCVGCGPFCVGSLGAGCIFCLVTSCGGFIASGGCCTGSGETHETCFPCSPPL
jgi:hypothetical protein